MRVAKIDLYKLALKLGGRRILGLDSEEGRRAYAKEIVEKSIEQERKYKKILKRLTRQQKKLLIKRLKKAKKLEAKKIIFNKQKEIKRWEKVSRPIVGKAFRDRLQETLNTLAQKQLDSIERLVEEFLNEGGLIFISRHLETVYNELLATLEEGIGNGESLDDLLLRVGHIYTTISAEDNGKANMITQLAIFGAINWAIAVAFAESGIVEGKEWVAVLDEKTRNHHIEANGQVVPLGEMFTVMGEKLRWPQDPMGSARNVINCRCVLSPTFIM